MSAVTSATDGFNMAREVLMKTSEYLAEGHVTPEVVAASEMAEVQMEAQVSMLKEAIAAEAAIFDVLV